MSVREFISQVSGSRTWRWTSRAPTSRVGCSGQLGWWPPRCFVWRIANPRVHVVMLCECCYRQSVAVAGWIVWGTIDPSVTKLPWHFPGCAVSTTQPPASPAPCLSQHVLTVTTFLLPTKCSSYRALCCARAGRIRFFSTWCSLIFHLFIYAYTRLSQEVCVWKLMHPHAQTLIIHWQQPWQRLFVILSFYIHLIRRETYFTDICFACLKAAIALAYCLFAGSFT